MYLRTFQRTRRQIIDNDNQCYYSEENFAHYTDHYILHCPATRRYRERLYIDIQHHQGNTSTRTCNIMKTQAARRHQELITLIGKFPIMQQHLHVHTRRSLKKQSSMGLEKVFKPYNNNNNNNMYEELVSRSVFVLQCV